MTIDTDKLTRDEHAALVRDFVSRYGAVALYDAADVIMPVAHSGYGYQCYALPRHCCGQCSEQIQPAPDYSYLSRDYRYLDRPDWGISNPGVPIASPPGLPVTTVFGPRIEPGGVHADAVFSATSDDAPFGMWDVEPHLRDAMERPLGDDAPEVVAVTCRRSPGAGGGLPDVLCVRIEYAVDDADATEHAMDAARVARVTSALRARAIVAGWSGALMFRFGPARPALRASAEY